MLDAFADIGGLSKMLHSSAYIVAFILGMGRIESFLASQLYKIKSTEGASNESDLIVP